MKSDSFSKDTVAVYKLCTQQSLWLCFVCVCVLVAQLCPTPCDPMVCQAPLSMGFSRQEHWSGLPFPSPGDLPDSGIKPESPAPPALAGKFFTTALPANHKGK